MSDDRREEICTDCRATEGDRDARIIMAGEDPDTGRMVTTVTYHHNDCPAYTVDQILLEDGARKVKEQDAWAKEALPAAHQRLLDAMMSRKIDEPAHPFVAALVELVEAQTEDMRRFVPPHRWAEILDRHFPPEAETPARPDEEPS